MLRGFKSRFDLSHAFRLIKAFRRLDMRLLLLQMTYGIPNLLRPSTGIKRRVSLNHLHCHLVTILTGSDILF